MLRAQKFGLEVMAGELGQYGWLHGVVNLLDALQDELANLYGDPAVFGPHDENGDLAGVGWCRYCEVPIALDDRGATPVWVDVTGGDACPVEFIADNGEYVDDHGHMLREDVR